MEQEVLLKTHREQILKPHESLGRMTCVFLAQ